MYERVPTTWSLLAYFGWSVGLPGTLNVFSICDSLGITLWNVFALLHFSPLHSQSECDFLFIATFVISPLISINNQLQQPSNDYSNHLSPHDFQMWIFLCYRHKHFEPRDSVCCHSVCVWAHEAVVVFYSNHVICIWVVWCLIRRTISCYVLTLMLISHYCVANISTVSRSYTISDWIWLIETSWFTPEIQASFFRTFAFLSRLARSVCRSLKKLNCIFLTNLLLRMENSLNSKISLSYTCLTAAQAYFAVPCSSSMILNKKLKIFPLLIPKQRNI